MLMGLEWEQIGFNEFRAKVQGGWLIQKFTKEFISCGNPECRSGGSNVSLGSMVFLPDSKYEWKCGFSEIEKKILFVIPDIEKELKDSEEEIHKIESDYYEDRKDKPANLRALQNELYAKCEELKDKIYREQIDVIQQRMKLPNTNPQYINSDKGKIEIAGIEKSIERLHDHTGGF